MNSHAIGKFIFPSWPPLEQPVAQVGLVTDFAFGDQGDIVFRIKASADDPTWVRFEWYNSTAVAGSSPVVGLGTAVNSANLLAAVNTDEVTTVSVRKLVADTDVYIGTVSGTWNAGAGVLTATILK